MLMLAPIRLTSISGILCVCLVLDFDRNAAAAEIRPVCRFGVTCAATFFVFVLLLKLKVPV